MRLRNEQRDGRSSEQEQHAPHRRDGVAVDERVRACGGGIGNEIGRGRRRGQRVENGDAERSAYLLR